MKILFGDASHLQIKEENDENIGITSNSPSLDCYKVTYHSWNFTFFEIKSKNGLSNM